MFLPQTCWITEVHGCALDSIKPMLMYECAGAGLGLSVDEGDSCKSKQSQAAPAEYEIIGADEQVLKENMEQLNVSAGCMLVLCISTCLLAEATELPAVVGHLGSLEELVEHAPALLSLCVDFSEQVCLVPHLYIAVACLLQLLMQRVLLLSLCMLNLFRSSSSRTPSLSRSLPAPYRITASVLEYFNHMKKHTSFPCG